MSICTAIDMNHDFYHHQSDTPNAFRRLLMDAIYHGRPEDWEKLRLEFGVHRVYPCHHSDDRLDARRGGTGQVSKASVKRNHDSVEVSGCPASTTFSVVLPHEEMLPNGRCRLLPASEAQPEGGGR